MQLAKLVVSNILLLLWGEENSIQSRGLNHPVLQPAEQLRWNELFAALDANQNFAFTRVVKSAADWVESPCGFAHHDFSTQVSVDCNEQGQLTRVVLVSAHPTMELLTKIKFSMDDFSALESLQISSSPAESSCGPRCEILPPISVWTSLRLQLGSELGGNRVLQCLHPCQCHQEGVIHCELDAATQTYSLTKLDLSNQGLSGAISLSHLVLPRTSVHPMAHKSAIATVPIQRIFSLANNPGLTTKDFAPFHCAHVPMCGNGVWECAFDLPNCKLDTDLGVWWELYAIYQQELEASTSCTRDDPCNTCPDSVLRCDANRIVYLNLAHVPIPSKLVNPSQFERLAALQTLKLGSAGKEQVACFTEPEACTSCLPRGLFCKENGVASARKLQDSLVTDRPTKRPSARPTLKPTRRPTFRPTKEPTTLKPTRSPTTLRPSTSPTPPTSRPSRAPSTRRPSKSPSTSKPTKSPTTPRPTNFPTVRPTRSPTVSKPTKSPTTQPTKSPTLSRPTKSPLNQAGLDALPRDNYVADLAAWQDFYDALGGPEWFKCRTARSNPCMCRETEKQVSCRGSGDALRIVAIDLSDNSMVGGLTSSMINAFSALELLDLSTRIGSKTANEIYVREECLRLNLDCHSVPERCMFTRSGEVPICGGPTQSPNNAPIGPGGDTRAPSRLPTKLPTNVPTTLRPTITSSPVATFVPSTLQTPSKAPTEARVPTYSPEPEYEYEVVAPTSRPTRPTRPTTRAPSSRAPTTQAPSTQAPSSQAPSSQAPSSQAPTLQPTVAPSTRAPTSTTTQPTVAPSQLPSTLAPTLFASPTISPESSSFSPTMYPTTLFPTLHPTQAPTPPTRSPVPF